METPRGLLIILGLLSLGFCWDVANIWHGGPIPVIVILVLLLIGRIAAIFGILQRTMTGWWLAVVFFFVIVALNAAAMMIAGETLAIAAGIRLVIPLGCLLYLVALRTEFE